MVSDGRSGPADDGPWDRLVRPAAVLGEVRARAQARLLATLMLVLIALFAAMDLVLVIALEDYLPPWYGYLVLLATYALARSRYARVGAWVLVLMFPLVGLGSIVGGHTIDPAFTFGLFILAILVGTIFMDVRGVVIITLTNVSVVAVSKLLAPELFPSAAPVVSGIAENLLAGLLAVVYMRHRDAVEAGRRDELLRAQEELRRSQKMEALGTFAGGIAHDFNNLLTVMKGNLVLVQGVETSEELSDIAAAVDSAAALTSQLLTVSRRGEHRAEAHDANEIVEGTCRMIRRIIGEDIEVVVELAEPGWWIRVDAHQLEQALLNLATNARDAMPEGGTLRVSTRNVDGGAGTAGSVPVAPDDQVLIEVSDTGEGMPPERRERIFEPFFTTKQQGKGTGLGLAMVFGTVTQSGGRIEVDSAPGAGTTFALAFPRVEAEEPIADSGVLERVPGRPTILVVEDDPAVQRLCRRVLEGGGYTAYGASDGPDALEALQAIEDLDLVLSDVVMPGMSGPELARRARRERGELPFVFMTGYSAGHLEPGSDPVIDKPFDEDELLSLVARTLRRARAKSGTGSASAQSRMPG